MTTVKLFATLRDKAGASEIEIPFERGGTARELIDAIEHVKPGLASAIITPEGELTGAVHIFVGGRNVEWLDGLDTMIEGGETVFLVPPAAGG
jgi:molybdopterin synthase sulfur carrier subunit